MCLVGCLQGSSVGLVNTVQPASSNAASADSTMSNKTEPILCFTEKQGHSSLSFSGLNVESSAADYQDCGASSMLLMGEPPWCPPCPESPFSSANRSDAVMRYKEKKKTRMWVYCQSKIYLVYSLGLPPFFFCDSQKETCTYFMWPFSFYFTENLIMLLTCWIFLPSCTCILYTVMFSSACILFLRKFVHTVQYSLMYHTIHKN